jgi:hypothetical protein
MFIRNQKGQSVVIFTVAIMLVIFIGLSVYSLGESLVAKTRFRNMADAVSFTGASMQFNGIGSFTNIYDMNVIISISYYMSTSAMILKDGAEALNKVAPGFDTTATALLFTKDNVVKETGNVTMFQKRLDQIIITPIDPQVVTPQIFNAIQNYHTANSLIFAKMIETQNLAKNNFTGYSSLVFPSEIIFNQGPIDPTVYKWNMRSTHARPKYRYTKTIGNAIDGYKDITLTGGNISILVADSPKMTFQKLLPASKSTKTGKIFAFSYGLAGDQTIGATIEMPIITSFNKLMEINAANQTRADNMTNWAKSATATNIQLVKNDWALMLADYNGFLTFLTQNGYDDCFRIYESSYTNTPQYGGLSSLNLLEIPAYQAICATKGLDYTDPDDAKAFYKLLTLKDIFGTVANFRSAVESSINTLSTDRTNQGTVVGALLNNLFALKSDHSNWNIPDLIDEYIVEVHKTENPSHLDPFLEVFQKVNNAIFESYTEVYNLDVLIPTITYDFNTLKPSQAFWDLVPKFFETPIIQLEGT